MNKSMKFALGGFLLLLIFLTYLEATQPEPINWNPSYVDSDKIALGSYVFFDSWQKNNLFDIEKVNVPPFEFLNKEPKGTYFFLNDYLVFDEDELNKLLSWVEKGNTIFLSANYISKNLLDTLKVEATTYSGMDEFVSRPVLNLVHPKLQDPEGHQIPFDIESLYFSEIDTSEQVVLGISDYKDETSQEKKVNFLRSPFGKGKILLHSNPEAFTNYFLLSNGNLNYPAGVISYIDQEKTVFWDSYYKSGKAFATSPLYILLNNRALKWAYYFALIGSLLFIIFEGKRKQRAIPVVEPLKNQTYEYSKTIADLYLEQNEFKALAEKKIEHFYDYLRTRFRIDTSWDNKAFITEIALKTGKTEAETEAYFREITALKNKPEITKQELQQLHEAIQSFKNVQNDKSK